MSSATRSSDVQCQETPAQAQSELPCSTWTLGGVDAVCPHQGGPSVLLSSQSQM